MIATLLHLPMPTKYPLTTMTLVEGLSSQVAYYDPSYSGAYPQSSSLVLDPTSYDLLKTVLLIRADEDEDSPPTDYSLSQLINLVPPARRRLGKLWREPHIETDGYGGMRLNWRGADKEVRAIIRGDATKQRYLYWEYGSKYGTVPDFTDTTLYAYLKMLESKDPLGI